MSAVPAIAYFRVSTASQERSGLGLGAQRHAVTNFLRGGAWKLIGEFTEVESGRRDDRIELQRALALCRLRKATLVIARLDRLSRRAAFILNMLDRSGVEFVAADNANANKLTVTVLAAVAEEEAEKISMRTKVALAEARRRGVQLGGHPERLDVDARRKGAAASARLRQGAASQHANDLAFIIEQIRGAGFLSLGAIARELNARGERTRNGAAWSATQVRRVLARLDS